MSKGGLISENFSVRSNLEKKMLNQIPEHYPPKDLTPFFGDLSLVETLSEIKLLKIHQVGR